MELFIKTYENSIDLYNKHSKTYDSDAGLDVFFTNDIIIPGKSTVLVDLEIAARMYNKKTNTFINYMLCPRSSIYKTPLRLSNSIGIIDSLYVGNLKVPLDNISELNYKIKRGQKLFQICHPSLKCFSVKYVEELGNTERGSNGFGSTNVN